MRPRDEAKALNNFNECLPKITIYLEKISIALTIIALQTETQETKDELNDAHNKKSDFERDMKSLEDAGILEIVEIPDRQQKKGAKDEKD
tara:strand:- start:840 stop:1109 length:270 start_codon:yes stop_codon:yes gene_type:complete